MRPPLRSSLFPYTTLFRNPVTVLLKVSRAMTLTLKGVPAVWVPIEPPPAASTLKWSRPARKSVVEGKSVERSGPWVPQWETRSISAPVPASVRVTEWEARTPEVIAAESVHAEVHVLLDLRSTVRVNPVTVLLKESRAMTLTLKGVPAVWVPIEPPPAASTLKWSRDPTSTRLNFSHQIRSDP